MPNHHGRRPSRDVSATPRAVTKATAWRGPRLSGSSGRAQVPVGSRLASLLAEKRGSVAIMAAAALPMLLGGAALGIEVSSWLLVKRAMQDAADSAALAASMNGGANYADEARAVAAQYGFRDGSNNITVTPTNTAPCPSGASNCYRVTVAGSQPLFLSKAIGYRGNLDVRGERRQGLSAAATVEPSTRYCILALGSSGEEGIRANGAPKANMAGCSVMSNTSATCNGHNLGAEAGHAHGRNDNCGVVQKSNRPAVPDPYQRLASNIPSHSCTSYPQIGSGKNKGRNSTFPPSNQWSGDKVLSGNTVVCGDLQLVDHVTIKPNSGAVLVIVNGRLDLNGKTLRTENGAALTIVFTGTSAGYTHAPTGNGTLDITAPTSGPWSGVAMFQDPGLTTGVNISAAGNSPTWNITGLVYLPRASVTFSGAVNKSANGRSCFALVVDNITINGTGSILANGDCAAAGLDLPLGRGGLVD